MRPSRRTPLLAAVLALCVRALLTGRCVHSQEGGAIYNDGGTMELHSCELTANKARWVRRRRPDRAISRRLVCST